MIRHIVLFRFKPEADAVRCDRLLREYATFPTLYPAMRNFTLGRNISERDQAYAYAFTVEFDDVVALNAYLNSAGHEEHVRERFKPLIASRAIATFEVASGAVTDLFDLGRTGS